jgi:hypothetical protein
MTAVAIVAVSAETARAAPVPGDAVRLLVASRPRKSPIGLSRYSTSSAASHGSGVRNQRPRLVILGSTDAGRRVRRSPGR